MQQIEANESGEPKPIRAVVVRKHKAQEDECAGKPADDHVHFHTMLIEFNLVKADCDHHTDNRAVNRTSERIAGERACAGGTADKFIPAKAKAASDDHSNNNAQNHSSFHIKRRLTCS